MHDVAVISINPDNLGSINFQIIIYSYFYGSLTNNKCYNNRVTNGNRNMWQSWYYQNLLQGKLQSRFYLSTPLARPRLFCANSIFVRVSLASRVTPFILIEVLLLLHGYLCESRSSSMIRNRYVRKFIFREFVIKSPPWLIFSVTR